MRARAQTPPTSMDEIARSDTSRRRSVPRRMPISRPSWALPGMYVSIATQLYADLQRPRRPTSCAAWRWYQVGAVLNDIDRLRRPAVPGRLPQVASNERRGSIRVASLFAKSRRK